MLDEFKKFVMKGNVLDLAVAVIIGGAFGKIVASMVADILMPVIGLALGKVDFTNLFVALDGGTYATLADAQEAGAPTLNYGIFLNFVVEFLIVAFVIFLIVKQANRLRRRRPARRNVRNAPRPFRSRQSAAPPARSHCPPSRSAKEKGPRLLAGLCCT